MKKLISILLLLCMAAPGAMARDLVVYFSAEGHTKAVAERIAALTGADIYRIEAAQPYAANPYDDSQRIQREAYGDLRPAVANPPSQQWIDGYDRIYVGSPCWWHQPAMVVCKFLESYDLSKHVIVPFITYGATTYLNETMQKIYRCTPNSVHVPATLPVDLDPDDITRPGRPDDAGIDMPGNAAGVEGWLKRLGLVGGAGIGDAEADAATAMRVVRSLNGVTVETGDLSASGTLEVYSADGRLVSRLEGQTAYSLSLPANSVYLLSMVYGDSRRETLKLAL